MTRKTNTLNLTNSMEHFTTVKLISAIVLVLSVLALTVVAALTVPSLIAPAVQNGTAAGVDASTARWTALGEYYSGESTARTADAARWPSLGEFFAHDYEGVASIDSAG